MIETLAIIPMMIIAQYFHEAGHYVVHKLNGYNPQIGFNNFGLPNRVYSFSNHFDSFKLDSATFAGIITGLFPIFVYFSLVKLSMPPILFISLFALTITLYFYSCRSDLKSFFKKEIVEGI